MGISTAQLSGGGGLGLYGDGTVFNLSTGLGPLVKTGWWVYLNFAHPLSYGGSAMRVLASADAVSHVVG
jgi:hypothetical protein